MIDLGQYDSAKDARNHKNWLLLKALWFWLTFIMFVGICILVGKSVTPNEITTDLALVFISSGCMAIVFFAVAIIQSLLWWDDDLDGLLPRKGGWRF